MTEAERIACARSGDVIPVVVPQGGPRIAVAVFVTVVVAAVLRAHVVVGARDGRLAVVEDIIGGRLPRPHMATGRGPIQARARSHCREPVAAKASIYRGIGVTPLPAGVLTGPQVFDVTWRRQGRRDLFACSRNGHGNSGAGVRGSVMVWQ